MGEKIPLVSVIVPCYNERNYIEKCIKSILSQNFPHGEFEIIIVDGLSTDGTRDILKCMAEKCSKIIIIDNEKRITPAAFNLGIQSARGEYISILGAHSEYDPHFLSNSLKLFLEHPGISCSGGPIISKGESNFGIAAALAMSQPLGVGNAKHRFPDYEGFAEGACFPTFKKEIFNKIGLYDESLVKNQDDELNFRLVENGGKIFISPSVKSVYYVKNDPASLFNQYYQYGFWRVKTIKKHKKIRSFRQVIPSLFFLLVIIMFLSGMAAPPQFHFLMFALPVLYLVVLAAFSLKISISGSLKIGVNFLFAVLILHSSYALGFFVSLLNRK
jgi:glycosyltransferase involved in cell wall biosynthesis